MAQPRQGFRALRLTPRRQRQHCWRRRRRHSRRRRSLRSASAWCVRLEVSPPASALSPARIVLLSCYFLLSCYILLSCYLAISCHLAILLLCSCYLVTLQQGVRENVLVSFIPPSPSPLVIVLPCICYPAILRACCLNLALLVLRAVPRFPLPLASRHTRTKRIYSTIEEPIA